MTDVPRIILPDKEYISCPCCTIQIAADSVRCPHCRQELTGSPGSPVPSPEKEEEFRQQLRDLHGKEFLAVFWDRYGKWIKVAVPLLAAAALLLIVYGTWVGHKVTVVHNPELPVKVKESRKDRGVYLDVTVTNMGEDVPDLSLRSIGIMVETVYRNGRREKKRFFPKSEYRGEGALLHGETASIRLEMPPRGLQEVILRSEVVDLGKDRILIPPGSGKKASSGRK